MESQTAQLIQLGLSGFALFRFFHSSLRPIKSNWIRIKNNNQNFGFYYNLSVIFPEVLYSFCAFTGFMIATLLIINAFIPTFPEFLNDKTSSLYYLFLTVLVAVLVLTAFDSKTIISKFFLLLTKDFNTKINQGWINAKWHIDEEPDYFVKINNKNVSKISNDIINLIVADGVDEQNRTSKPNVTQEELCNYLLLGNSIENLIHRDHRGNKNFLPIWWKFMKFCAESDQRPFLPSGINEAITEEKDFYNYLKVIAGDNVEIVTINNLDINEVMRENTRVLSKSFSGNALNLTKTWYGGNSVRRLMKNLKKFKSFRKVDDRDETYKRLYFKQAAIRHKLWPKMKIKNFLFPHSSGITVFFLNSELLNVNPKKNVLKEDLNFKNLIVSCQTEVVKEVYRKIRVNPDDRAALTFIKNIGHDPELFRIADTLDYVLFNHARKYCSELIQPDSSGYDINCRLGDNTLGQCVCDLSPVRWRRGTEGYLNKIV